jgi:MYXO-CTERM domain-containing protein
MGRLGALAGVLLLLAAARPAKADILPRGYRKVPVTATVDLGEFAPHVSWVHVVKEGETLEVLARTLLGSPERAADVVREDGTRASDPLRPGERLVLPPRPTPKPAPLGVAWWDAVVHGQISPPSVPGRFFPGERLPSTSKSTVVYLVPHELMPLWASAEHRLAGDLSKEPRALRTKDFSMHGSVRETDRTQSIQRDYRIARGEKNLLQLTLLEERHLDGEGKVVGGGLWGPTWGSESYTTWILPALAGLLGLAAVALWRRRRPHLPTA